MQKILRGRWWLAALLLAVGCRSKQAVFSFRPAAPLSAAAAVAAASPAASLSLDPPLAPALPAPAPPVALAAPVSDTKVAPAEASARPAARRLKRATARLGSLTTVRARRAETAARASHRDTLHWVLGGALVVAGIVGGLLLGGWLGLGVGAALVLLGYYFVVLGLGGRQAWLEVFQEFFNM